MAFPGSGLDRPPQSYCIYKAVAPSGKVYVGMTRQALKRRVQQHYSSAKRDRRQGRLLLYFQKALLKYGTAIQWSVLEEGLTYEEACIREKWHIQELQSLDSSLGYNGTVGGNAGRKSRMLPEDHRRNIQLAEAHPVLRSDGRPFLSARHASQDLGARVEDAVGQSMRRGCSCGGFTFKRISMEEYREALASWSFLVRAGHVEQKPKWTRSRKGYKHTREARQNMSRAFHRRGGLSEPHRQNRLRAIRKKVSRSDGRVFPSIQEAAAEMELSPDQMSYSIRKGCVREGFTFTFVDPDGSVAR